MTRKTLLVILLLSLTCLAACRRQTYDGGSLAVVTMVGAHIKARDIPIVTKYARKDCPVCKGTGKYLSGDGIKEVDCGYCEP
jgi:hypothetical protein